MITDEERREIAAKLREVNPYRNQSYTVPYNRYTPASEYLSELAGALGYSPKNDVSRLEFQSRLADLIESSETKVKCVAEVKVDGEQLEKLVHEAVVEYAGVDRDALLALADRMEAMAKGTCFLHEMSFDLWKFASTIRKAVGA